MKHYFLFFIILFWNTSFSQENGESNGDFTYKATYQLTFQPDSTDTESKKIEKMFLYLGDNISKFSSAGKTIKDSLMANRDRSNKSMANFARMRAQIPETEFNYSIYKHIPAGKLSFTEEILKDNFKYTEDLNLFNWKIEAETKELYGYQVQKATTNFAGREYTAWFTSEIPIPDGPYKFNGLPGLILKIKDANEHYIFELTNFEILEEPISLEYDAKDYISTSEAKFIKVKREYNRDPIAAVERTGITFGFEPGQRERMNKEHLEQLRKKNNPIELE